jgi:hypothetical protein
MLALCTAAAVGVCTDPQTNRSVSQDQTPERRLRSVTTRIILTDRLV